MLSIPPLQMRSSTFTTRLYSPVSTAAVDLCLSDLYKVCRLSGY